MLHLEGGLLLCLEVCVDGLGGRGSHEVAGRNAICVTAHRLGHPVIAMGRQSAQQPDEHCRGGLPVQAPVRRLEEKVMGGVPRARGTTRNDRQRSCVA